MKSLIFVLGLVIAAGPRARSMFIDPGEQFCIDFPYEDDKAIAACQWILDVGSPFRKCMNAFDVGRVKEFYSMCLDIFCDKGEKGVCEFAANLGDICDEKYDITINGGPDFCAPVPTTPESYCTDVPGKDENAIEACDWLLDVHSPFRRCLKKFTLSKIKQIYQTCLSIFCEKGKSGVCEYADNVGDICKENKVVVHGRPDFCTETPPSCGDGAASEACSWIINVGTSFHDCLSSFGVGKIKMMYKDCVDIFCDKGQIGVCDNANNLAGLCEEHCMMTINFRPNFCAPIPEIGGTSFCGGSPYQDADAITACSWLLDNHGSFNLCSHMLGIASDTEQYHACLDTYCNHGNDGVCHYATRIAGTCESSFGFPVGGSLPFC